MRDWLPSSDWPETDRSLRAPKYLFAGRPPFRKMRVMVDAELVADSDETSPARRLLADLIDHDMLSGYRYADDGPPPEVEADPENKVPPGWVVADERHGRDHWPVRKTPSSGERWIESGVSGETVAFTEEDVARTGFYKELGATEAARRRGLDALAARVAAQAVHADVYVSERPFLYYGPWGVTQGTTLVTTQEALALIGLYFRAQGQFLVTRRSRFSRGLYFWVGTRDLLPEAWRWFSACVKEDSAIGDDSLTLLGGSLLQRVSRSLETRDAIHIALNQPQNNDTQDNALGNLDVVLLFLMGAVDVAAGVAHRVLELSGDTNRAGWRRQAWLSKVSKAAPELAALVSGSTPGNRALTILAELRNSVHGEALHGLAHRELGKPQQSLVTIPKSRMSEVRDAMEALGGEKAWGVRPLAPDRLLLDPGVFVDRLFAGVVTLLNDLMRLTPVEHLSHVQLAPEDATPPPDSDFFSERVRSSIRLQLGL